MLTSVFAEPPPLLEQIRGVLLHFLRDVIFHRSADPRPQKIEQQHAPRPLRVVPRLVLDGIVENHAAAFPPLARFVADPQGAAVGNDQGQVQAVDAGGPADVRLDVRPPKRVFENAFARSIPTIVTQRRTTLRAAPAVRCASQIGSSGLGIADAVQDAIAENVEVQVK